WFRSGIEAWPQRYEPYYFEGVLLANENRHDEAVIRFRKALEFPPPNVDVTRALIGSLRRAGRLDEAEAFALAWAETFPGDADAPAALAHILMEAGRLEEALAAAQKAWAMAPGSDARILEARILLLLGKVEEALATLNAARAADPDNAGIYLHLGTALKVAGRFDEARTALGRAIQINPKDVEAYAALAEITRITATDPLLAAMDRLAGEWQQKSGKVPAKLHFALGKSLDDAEEFDKAFHHFAAGNAALAKSLPYNEAATLAVMERLKALFSAETVARLAETGSQSELPIFIVGLPRSGTTLVEQILSSHPQVAAAGEVRYLPQAAEKALDLSNGMVALNLNAEAAIEIAANYLSRLETKASGRPRVTDKLPANALLAGLIHAALPRARIIHCRRDLMDVGLSCFAAPFGERMPFSRDLGALGRYIRAHEALMEHWRAILPPETFIEVEYEAVVSDLEKQARRLVAACGLDWDERCLAFHQNARPVNTASVAQVRTPLHDRSVGRWRRYEKHLRPLRQALGIL
ncbi:MAG: sulfotransferase, partial [Alphaproteobacteria bacterium]|nr:sulfotransferase [Alphaproteobacteria bacterium]